MKYQLLTVSSDFQLEMIYSKMDLIFGKQSHLKTELVLDVAKTYPGLVNIAIDKNREQLGHIVFIPFNRIGHKKMLSPSFSENDLSFEDLYREGVDERAYLFVYSIYSQSFRLTKALIAQTVLIIQSKFHQLGVAPEIFTEVVSREGSLLAKKLSLSKNYEYEYEGELIKIYQSKLESFIKSFS